MESMRPSVTREAERRLARAHLKARINSRTLSAVAIETHATPRAPAMAPAKRRRRRTARRGVGCLQKSVTASARSEVFCIRSTDDETKGLDIMNANRKKTAITKPASRRVCQQPTRGVCGERDPIQPGPRIPEP
eukprot:2773803-Rhodomonas_salina.3